MSGRGYTSAVGTARVPHPRLGQCSENVIRRAALVRIVGARLAWRCARATGWTLALAGAAPGLDAGRALAAGGVVARNRRRRPAAPLRPAVSAGRAPRARGRPRA